MARPVDCAIPLASYPVLPLLDQSFRSQSPYLSFVARRQAGSVTGAIAPGERYNGLIADDANRISLSSLTLNRGTTDLKLARFPSRSPLLYVDRSHSPSAHASYLAALPSTRAVSQTRVFYVADPLSSVRAKRFGVRSCCAACGS
jgi:hypothetical protein